MASQPTKSAEEGQVLSKKLVGGYLYKLVGIPKPVENNLHRATTSSASKPIIITQSPASPSQSCRTSGYMLPPYILGRQVAEEQAEASAKPRLGVKVSNLNLSSPILSREELYEEVAKRSVAQSTISRKPTDSLKASPTPTCPSLTITPKVSVAKSKSQPRQRSEQLEPPGPVKKKKPNTVVVIFNQTQTPEQRTFLANHLYASNFAFDRKMTEAGATGDKFVPKNTSGIPSPVESPKNDVVLYDGELFQDDMVTEGEEYVTELVIHTSEPTERELADVTAVIETDRIEDVEAAMAALHGERRGEEHPTTEPSIINTFTNAGCRTQVLNEDAERLERLASSEAADCSKDTEKLLNASGNADTFEGQVLLEKVADTGLSDTPIVGGVVALTTHFTFDLTENNVAKHGIPMSDIMKPQAEENRTSHHILPQVQSKPPSLQSETPTTTLVTIPLDDAVVNTQFSDRETPKETVSVAESKTEPSENLNRESDLEIIGEIPAQAIGQHAMGKGDIRDPGPAEKASPRKTSTILRRKKRKLTGTCFVRKSEGCSVNKPRFSRDLSNLFCDEGVINMLNTSQAPTGRRRSAPSNISGGLNALPTNLLSKGCLNAIQRVTKTLRRKSSTRIEKTSQIAKPRRKPLATSRAKTESEDKVVQQWEALPAPGNKNGHIVYVPKKKAQTATNSPKIVRRRSCTSEESSEPEASLNRKSIVSLDTNVEIDQACSPAVNCGEKSRVVKKRGKRRTLETAQSGANNEEMEVILSPRKKGPSLLAGLEKREKEKTVSLTAPFTVPGTSSCTDQFALPPISPDKGLIRVLSYLEHEEQLRAKRRLMSHGNKGEEDHVGGLRTSLRQTEGSFHYKEIILRKHDNFVQILFNPTSTTLKNSFNVQVLKEFREALQSLNKDPTCKVVLVMSHGSVFCQGIDLHALVQSVPEKRKKVAEETATALKEFLLALAQFSKPLIAGVNGAAVGLGVTMLPFFDVVWVSEKATFYTPYSKLGQVPEGAVSLTFYQQLRQSLTSVLLYEGRSVTATEALHQGLANDILWPSKFQEELLPRVLLMANQSSQAMEATKALLRHPLRSRLEAVLNGECRLLVQHWSSSEGQRLMKTFLESENVVL